MDSVKLPDNIDVNNLDLDVLTTWIVDFTFTIYASSEVKNDFVMLHAVTSAWSLKQVMTYYCLILKSGEPNLTKGTPS